MNLLAAELATPIEGFPLYRVTSLGRVISLHKRSPAELKLVVGQKGYLQVSLRHQGTARFARVHQLVAEAFVPNPSGLPCVRHLDGNRTNNTVGNLAWGTHQENEDDKRAHGTWGTRRTGKLTPEARQQANAHLAEGWSHKKVADLLGVSRSTITRLANGSTWGTLE